MVSVTATAPVIIIIHMIIIIIIIIIIVIIVLIMKIIIVEMISSSSCYSYHSLLFFLFTFGAKVLQGNLLTLRKIRRESASRKVKNQFMGYISKDSALK